MKKKWLILLAIPVLLIAILVCALGSGETPVELVGEMPEQDVAEITARVKQMLRQQILPDLSWRSVKHIPKALKNYSTIKLITIVADPNRSATVVAWLNTNNVPYFSSTTGHADQSLIFRKYNILHSAVSNSFLLKMKRQTNGWESIVFEGF